MNEIGSSGPEQVPACGEAETIIVSARIACWRCAKPTVKGMLRCPYCSAKLLHRVSVPAIPIDPDARAIVRVMVVFGALLLTSIITGAVTRSGLYVPQEASHPENREVLTVLLTVEAIDSVLVLSAWAWIGNSFRESRRSISRRLLVWVVSLPMLAIALLINHAYHCLLLDWLKVVPVVESIGSAPITLVGWIGVSCIQPALIEELFFRYLAFDALRRVMGGHLVVWVTATMFALAHIGAPLSMPILFGMGLLLGYARFMSGGILLPITMHFLHNAAVMAITVQIC